MNLSDRKFVLVIDDEEAMRECISFFLEEYGFAVTTRENGREGLELFRLNHFDLVVTDIMMPNMDGLTVIREFLKINPATKIIAVSGFDMSETLLYTAKQYGAVHTLKKPFARETLINTVRDVMANNTVVEELPEN